LETAARAVLLVDDGPQQEGQEIRVLLCPGWEKKNSINNTGIRAPKTWHTVKKR